MQQVVDRGHLVVLVGVQSHLSLFLRVAILVQHTHDTLFKRDLVLPDDQATVVDNWLVEPVPLVVGDLLSSEPLKRINVEYLLNKVGTVL